MPQDKSRDEALDRFWTIDELLPSKQSTPRTPPQPHSTEPVELTLDPPAGDAAATGASPLTLGERPPRSAAAEKPLVYHTIPPREAAEERRKAAPIDTYHPENSLIHTVRIYRWPSAYNYYERFMADARRYLHVDAPPCPREPFFSYVPQYAQLTEKRLAWYLYWRSQVRQGIYPECDYTYLLLYLYEIINLSGEDIPPAEGLAALCALWRAYRATYTRLDRFMGEWICDYCLIHHLPPPTEALGADIETLVVSSALKEFWLDRPGEAGGAYVDALIRFASNYDYGKSKFAAGDNLALYDRHIRGAMAHVVAAVAGDRTHLLSGGGLQDSLLSRDAFGGALCAHENKYRIEVDYCCFTRSHELRFLVTDIIKYSENRLRAHLGIKSRLGLYALPNDIRALIDAYMNEALPRKQAMTPSKKAEAAEEKRYAPLYEPLSTTLSPDRAAEIERASWQTTQRLVEAFGETEPEPVETPAPIPMPEPTPAPTPSPAPRAGLCGALETMGLADFVRAILDSNTEAAKAAASRVGMMLDAAVERVNEAAIEASGDILIEDSGSGYAVIDDYRDEVAGL
ncbi:MAG: TerB N-terminal domain-containing protein [Clostridia bacterium]|nr:TerB N-terminal domain-containing protein [Clostridia bacterium]